MRFPSFRPTLNRIVVVIAIGAVSIAVIDWMRELSRWSGFYENAAEDHSEHERALQETLRSVDASRDQSAGADPKVLALQGYTRRRAAYHAEMARKYRQASVHPWGPIPTDPGEPADVRFRRSFDNVDDAFVPQPPPILQVETLNIPRG